VTSGLYVGGPNPACYAGLSYSTPSAYACRPITHGYAARCAVTDQHPTRAARVGTPLSAPPRLVCDLDFGLRRRTYANGVDAACSVRQRRYVT